MPDLRMVRTSSGDWDLDFDGADLVTGDDLETSIALSLLTWARRAADDPDPTPGGDPMGWWADETLEPANDFQGSKLWLSARSKITPDLFLQVSQWGRDALAWLLEDQVAEAVTVTPAASPEADRVDVVVVVQRPGGLSVDYRFELNWRAQSARGRT